MDRRFMRMATYLPLAWNNGSHISIGADILHYITQNKNIKKISFYNQMPLNLIICLWLDK
jgi:hypothetical protein